MQLTATNGRISHLRDPGRQTRFKCETNNAFMIKTCVFKPKSVVFVSYFSFWVQRNNRLILLADMLASANGHIWLNSASSSF